MRICRFDDQRVGIVNGDIVADVTDITELLPAERWPRRPGDLLVRNLDTLAPALAGAAAGAAKFSLSEVSLLSPVANPENVIAAGAPSDAGSDGPNGNGMDPRLFLKPPSGVCGAGAAFAVPREHPARYGMALAAIVGAAGRDIRPEEALRAIAGYTIGLFRIGTSIRDGGLVLGPFMITADEIGDPAALSLRMTRNDKTVQEGDTAPLGDLLPDILAEASRWLNLAPGDIVLAGLPGAGAPLAPDDRIACRIGTLGTLRVTAGGL